MSGGRTVDGTVTARPSSENLAPFVQGGVPCREGMGKIRQTPAGEKVLSSQELEETQTCWVLKSSKGK